MDEDELLHEITFNNNHNNSQDPYILRRSITPPLPIRTPSPPVLNGIRGQSNENMEKKETINGVRGQLEGKLERRESPDALLARNILHSSPTTAGRLAVGMQDLKWKQKADAIGAHIKEKLSNPKDIAEEPANATSFLDRQEAIKMGLTGRSQRNDLVKRGILDDEADGQELTSSILPRVRKPPTSVPSLGALPSPTSPHSPHSPYLSPSSPTVPNHSSSASHFSLSTNVPPPSIALSPTPPKSPFSNRRKRASSLILPSRSNTPIQQDHASDTEVISSPATPVRVTARSSYSHLLTSDVRNAAYDLVSLQLSQNGMMVQRLEGEAGIPHICCTGDYVWVGYKSGTALAFQSICLEPNDDLRHYPTSSHAFIRALICVGSQVWCGYTSGEIQVWDGSDGQVLHSINAHPGVGVSTLFYSERSNCVWSGGGDGRVCVWNATSRQCVRRMGQAHAGAVHVITQIGNYVWTMSDSAAGAFLYEDDVVSSNGHGPGGYTANGKHSARAGGLSPVPYARTPTPPPSIRERKSRMGGGSSSSLGSIVSSVNDRDREPDKDKEKEKEKERSMDGGEEMPSSVVHLGAGVLCLLGVPVYETGATLMWTGTTDGQIRVVDPETKEVVRVLQGHTSKVNTMILVGAHVWSASNDKSIRIWSAKSMEALKTISDAHSSNIYALAQARSTACYVWSAGSDRSVRVWLAAGAIELVGSFLENSLQGVAELETRQRRSEEKLAQSEAHAKQSAEEISSLRLKLKTQVGEAMNARHEMELLAQEVASVDQWHRKMQALKAVYHSDKAVLKDKLAKSQDVIEQLEGELDDLKEKLVETEAAVYRSQNDRTAIEAETREMGVYLQRVEAEYIARLQQLEKKEIEDAEVRRLLEMKLKEGHETESRLRQSILLLESRSKKSSSRPGSSIGRVSPVIRGRSSTIGGGELPLIPPRFTPTPSSLSPTSPNQHSPTPSPTRPHIPRLALFGNKEGKETAEKEVKTHEEDETGMQTTRGENVEEEIEIEEEEDEEELEEEEEEEEEEAVDVTVSLADVLGMVKFKGERATALHDRIHQLSSKLQQLHHQDHILQLQRLHHQQLELVRRSVREKEKEGRNGGEGGMGRWRGMREQVGFVFLVFVVVMGVFLFEVRNRIYFDSLHPS